MVKALEIAVVLSAVDRMTQVFNTAVNASSAKLKGLQDQFKDNFKTGSILTAAGVSIGMALAPAIEAYAVLEDSSTAMQASMLKDGAVIADTFSKVNDLSVELGNLLPGTTADFQNMFTAATQLGITQQSILDGVGKSAAYLAVGLKVPYEEAGTLTAKLKQALGIADSEMLQFIDVLSRVRNVGVQPTEMVYAFARQAGALKTLHLQGLEASKSMATVNAMLIKTGATGETVGTGMAALLNQMFDARKMARFNNEAAKVGMAFEFVDKKTGQFKGIENMMAQFDQIKRLNPQEISNMAQAFVGPGQDANFMKILINEGVAGYNAMQKKMAEQATLNTKVEMQLLTLKNVYEAAAGTWTNALASFGKALGPELKFLLDTFTKISAWIQQFSEAHPKLMKFIALFIAITSVVLVLVGVVFLLKAAFLILTAVMMANPIILIIVGIIALVALIITYWDEIAHFFVQLWSGIKKTFSSAWGFITSLFKGFVRFVYQWGQALLMPLLFPAIFIIQNWQKIQVFFGKLWSGVRAIFIGFVKWFVGLGVKFYDAGKNIVLSIWNGIKSLAMKPIEAIKAIVQKMRDYLPFSPAKEGPFRDLHRVKIVETIAMAMKPAPMIRAMQLVTATASRQLGTPSSVGAGNNSFTGGSYGGIHFSYSPQVTISGGATPQAQESFANMLKQHKDEIMRMIDEAVSRRNRTSF
jgi:TP901 family phage tail tape measure protein